MKKYKLKRHPGSPKRDYTIDYPNELNPAQLKAVTHLKGPQLIIAGAGSGKTRTLIYRVAYLVENDVNPESILLLTFTRKAAQEMMRRASTILDDRCSRVAGGTFHSFANLVLRKYAPYIRFHPSFTILDRGDAEDIVAVIRADLGLNKKERRFPKKATVLDIISRSVNKFATFEDILLDNYPQYQEELPDITKIAELYADYKRQKQVMDYDDLLVYLHELLDKNEHIRQKISQSYRYIMVDEYQDTNKLQADITRLLACSHHNVTAVGDDSQSIYSFRGANFRNIMDFPSLFPGATVTTLEQNYRSTRPILDLTNAIIENAHEKYSKKLFSHIEGDEKPIYLKSLDEAEQSFFVAQRVLDLREEGIPLDEIAVLFRAGWHSNELEIELKNRNIPYAKYGGIKFAEAAHVKDLIAFLKVLYNPFDEISWLRILLLVEGIGPGTARKIFARIMEKEGDLEALVGPDMAKKKYFHTLYKLYKTLSGIQKPAIVPAEQLQQIVVFYTPLFELRYDDFKRRTNDIESLIRIAQRYRNLEQMLSELVLDPLDTSQVDTEPDDKEDEKLTLSTIHSAKGLEWHTVFIIHLVDGYFPSNRSLEKEEDIEEERRLFYVAATRAKRGLYLLAPELETRSWNYFSPPGHAFSEPSRFITEIDKFPDLTEPWSLEFDDDPF